MMHVNILNTNHLNNEALVISPLFRSGFPNLLFKSKIFNPSKRDSIIPTVASLMHFCTTPNSSFPWDRYPKKIRLLETKTHTCPKKIEAFLKEELNRATIQQAYLKPKTQNIFERTFIFLFGENTKTTPMQVQDYQEYGCVVAAAKGIKVSMEDVYLANRFQVIVGGQIKTAVVSAIFDGHGGDECAKFASEYLTEFLIKYIEANNKSELSNLGIWNALTLALVHLSQSYNPSQYPEGQFNWGAGTTANIILTIDQTKWIANVGDSRAVVVKHNGTVQQLSEDAKAGLLRYKERVDMRFGTVVYDPIDVPRINGQLAVGGALGDHNLNGAVSARPAITKLDMTDPDLKGAMLVQASDGLWDIFTPEQVAKLCIRLSQNGKSNQSIAEALVQSAYQKGSADNITVLISTV